MLSLRCLCDCGYTAVSQHLAEVLKRVRSLLGPNDNRNHPNSEGDYLSGDLFTEWHVFLQDLFAVTDISNKLRLSPPPNPRLAFERHETKSCEIKPAVRARKMES